MGSQRIIIDGYNVVFADTSLRRIAIKDRTRAREALIAKVRDYIEVRSTTIVFDGRGSYLDTEAIVPGRLQIIYSPDAQTADEVIVATLNNAQSPQSYIIVTSDMVDIGRTARALGCSVIGSKRFLDRMEQGDGDRSEQKLARDDEMNDTDYWLRKFGEVEDPGDS
ncbi:MAG: NYN domain-containing protein [bacterium]|nr:NYN domain-containing protein [bacterium]